MYLLLEKTTNMWRLMSQHDIQIIQWHKDAVDVTANEHTGLVTVALTSDPNRIAFTGIVPVVWFRC